MIAPCKLGHGYMVFFKQIVFYWVQECYEKNSRRLECLIIMPTIRLNIIIYNNHVDKACKSKTNTKPTIQYMI